MRKQGGTSLRKTAAILLSGILSLGIVFGGVTPVTVLAQENSGTESMTHDDTVSGNTVEIPAKPPVEQRDETAKKDVSAENTVSGNEIMTAAETAEDSGREAGSSGTDWELSANGTLTIDSDAGMADWKDNGWSVYKTDVTEVVIADGVTEIGSWAFKECVHMKSVTMPNSLEKIGEKAFYSCEELLRVSIPDSVTEIGNNAFEYCIAMTTVVISDNVTGFMNCLFHNCYSLMSVRLPENLEGMGYMVFSGCKNLREITIPAKVKNLGGYLFEDCTALNKVIFLSDTPPDPGAFPFKNITFSEGSIIVPPGKENEYKNRLGTTFSDYIKEHVHNWETIWTSDADGHWHNCVETYCTTVSDVDKDSYAIHTEDAGTITKQPTQTEAGIRAYHCSVCGYKMREEAIPATGTADDNIPDVSGNDEENNGRPQNPSDPEDNGGNPGFDNADSSDSSDNGGGSNRPASAEEVAVNDVSSNNVYDNIISDKNSTTAGPGVPAKDDEPKTGDSTHIELYATLAMVMGFTWLLLYFADNRRGMTEEEKRELVSKLICWAKQGAKLRRICAVAAIFVLLFYYHSIGKRIAVEWKRAYGE